MQDWHIKLLKNANVPVSIRACGILRFDRLTTNGLQAWMVAHGKALRAYHDIHGCLAIVVHEVLAEDSAVVLAQAGAEDRERVASLLLQRVHHRVHELKVLAHPVGAVKEQCGGRLAGIAMQTAVLVELHGVQRSRAIYAVLRKRHGRFVAVLAAQRLVAQELEQVDEIGDSAVIQVREGGLRHDWRRGRAALEHRIAHRLAGAGD